MDIVIFIELTRYQVTDDNDIKSDILVFSSLFWLQLGCYCVSVCFVFGEACLFNL